MKKVERYCAKIQKNCNKCSGIGCPVCNSKKNRAKKYSNASIPVEYWPHSFKNFDGDSLFKKAMEPYIKDTEKMFDEGSSLMFVGSLGTGKSYMACCMLKMAITKDFSCKYTNMADIVNMILSSSVDSFAYLRQLASYDFLVIDEFDSRWIFPSEKSEQIFGSSLEYVLRTRFQNHLPTILCSNTEDTDKVLSGYFSKAFSSLRKKYVKVFYVSGKDYRGV
jgi:DNA replication protein DnaC